MLIYKIKSLPDNSGVYQFFNKNGNLLYIGKAKNLKNRVKSYFKFTPILQPNSNLSLRISKMVSEIFDLKYIVTESEQDALILENNLIKEFKPKYNILLRDDKTYPYIYINFNEDFPRFEITRKVINQKNIKYFGPFTTASKEILESIYEIFKLKQKKNCKKSCLFFQIEKCLAPCENLISKDEYKKIVNSAIEVIKNKNILIEKLEEKMFKLSKNLKFEEALKIRDRVEIIKKSQIKSNIDFLNLENLDIFAIEKIKNRVVILKVFLRDSKIVSSSHNIIYLDSDFDLNEIYKSAIINFYKNELPLEIKTILIANEFNYKDEIEKYLRDKFNKKIDIIFPKKGNKKSLINFAKNNALEILKVNPKESILEELRKEFNLTNYPNRIEIFDNSHISFTNIVGAMVVYENGKFLKSEYRKYNLKSKNEYEQMQELLTNRLKSSSNKNIADLWIIDGGETLLKLAKEIIESSGLNIDVISIAKEQKNGKINRMKSKAKDKIYIIGRVFEFDLLNKKLLFLQKLRDEAHRFAINFHREKKRKSDMQIELLKIKGIGKVKVMKLLNYFGSFENIKLASLKDLEIVLNPKDSNEIFNYFLKDRDS